MPEAAHNTESALPSQQRCFRSTPPTAPHQSWLKHARSTPPMAPLLKHLGNLKTEKRRGLQLFSIADYRVTPNHEFWGENTVNRRFCGPKETKDNPQSQKSCREPGIFVFAMVGCHNGAYRVRQVRNPQATSMDSSSQRNIAREKLVKFSRSQQGIPYLREYRQKNKAA